MVFSTMSMVGGTKVLLWTSALVFTNLLTAFIFTITNQATYTGPLCPEYSGIQGLNSLNYDIDRAYDFDNQPFISSNINNNKDTSNDNILPSISKREINNGSSRPRQRTLPWVNIGSSMKIVQANCTILKKEDGCRASQFEALVNLADQSVCKCEPGFLNTQVNSCLHKIEEEKQIEEERKKFEQGRDIPTIFAITPTYSRTTQKVDLTSLCHTVKLIPHFVWIIIEDSEKKTPLVTKLLERCGVDSIHLNIRTPIRMRPRPSQERNPSLYSRGVAQRNAGLSWIKDHCAESGCRGVVYFMDDDNKYDLRLFEQMRRTVGVSVFPVGFSGGLKFEGPMCVNGNASKWHVAWDPKRPFPIDMAGFAINVDKVMKKPNVRVGFQDDGKPTKRGHLETAFLENFATRATAECRGITNEILVWHVKTQKPLIVYEGKHASDPHYEV